VYCRLQKRRQGLCSVKEAKHLEFISLNECQVEANTVKPFYRPQMNADKDQRFYARLICVHLQLVISIFLL
jgi:hypothetical protein